MGVNIGVIALDLEGIERDRKGGNIGIILLDLEGRERANKSEYWRHCTRLRR